MRRPKEKPMARSKNKQKIKRKLHNQKRLRRIKRGKAAAAAK
jgi:ribosomal protein L7Ae-like RNA K-turn-binding protein